MDMPNLQKKHVVILLAATAAAVAAPFLLISYTPGAYLRGELAASRDVHNGRYIELGFGLPVPWLPRGIELLRQRHPEAEFRPVAGCVVSDSLVDYVAGYNSYSVKATTRHFGRNIFDEAFNDAAAEYKEAHPKSAD